MSADETGTTSSTYGRQGTTTTRQSAKTSRDVDIAELTERLQAPTKSSGGGTCKIEVPSVEDTVSRTPAGDVSIISARLCRTHTKSSSGATQCRPMEALPAPGFGLKMYPAIDGLDTRFKGRTVGKEETSKVFERLSSASTKASRARVENHGILLYPERTLLYNNVDRITAFHGNGSITKQNLLNSREKWYN